MTFIKRMEPLWLLVVIIGCLNWAVLALFDTNVVSEIFGSGTATDVVVLRHRLRGPDVRAAVARRHAHHRPDARALALARRAGRQPHHHRAAVRRDGGAVRHGTGRGGRRWGAPAGRDATVPGPRALPGRDLHPRRAGRASLRTSRTSTCPVFALVNLPETVKGALFARYSRYQGTLRRLFLDEFADSLPARDPHQPSDGDEGERAAKLYEHDLPRLRRRLRRPARRRPRRLRVGLQRDDQGAPAPADRRLPRAVHALHRLRRADAGRRLPLLPRPRARPRVRAGDGRGLLDLLGLAAAGASRGPTRRSRRPTASPAPRTAARSAPRRSTCCAGCCPPPRCRTWASTRAARPTSS